MPSRLIAIAIIAALAAALSACNKVPESEEAKKIGNIPKQTLDKVQADVNAAMKKEEKNTHDADENQQK
jgi:ABC-type sugar transport system substrate-binding protein